MRNNIFVPIKLPVAYLYFRLDATEINLYKSIVAVIPGYLKRKLDTANALRIYVHSGTMGILIDGNKATQTNCLKITEEQHFVENVDPKTISLIGVGGDAIVTIQLGEIS